MSQLSNQMIIELFGQVAVTVGLSTQIHPELLKGQTMPDKKIANVTLEGVKLFGKNFSGFAKEFNPEGHRNFCVFLDEDIAQAMTDDGWPVKWLEPKPEYEQEAKPFVKVKVRFGKYPPRVILKSSRGYTKLEENGVNMLDWADVINWDMIITPSRYDRNGKKGVAVYAKSIYATIELDDLEKKYYDVPQSALYGLPVTGEPDEEEDREE